MPTILNNACVNRVAKVLKLKLTSNDLTQMKVTPFLLFKIKDGQSLKFFSNILFVVPSGHGYSGSMYLSSCGGIQGVSFSFAAGNVFDSWSINPIEGDGVNCYLSVDSDFVIGDVRPDIEIHFYYYDESCTVNFDSNYILYKE